MIIGLSRNVLKIVDGELFELLKLMSKAFSTELTDYGVDAGDEALQ